MPPTATLTEDEQQMWRWLLEHIYIPHGHGSADALLFTKICKLWARANLSALRDCRSHRERFDGI